MIKSKNSRLEKVKNNLLLIIVNNCYNKINFFLDKPKNFCHYCSS
jgi:hypothetical protein